MRDGLVTEYLSILFDASDYINVCHFNVKEIQSVPAVSVKEGPRWVCVNPLEPGSTRRQANLSGYRNVLIEFDGMTRDEQLQLAGNLAIPFSTAVFSGNDSIHFVISLDYAIDAQLYRRLCERIKRAVSDADSACLEPARLTRMPRSDQPVWELKRRRSLKEVDAWLNDLGVTWDDVRRRELEKAQIIHEIRLTHTSMQFLAGQVSKKDGHRIALHTAKNLFELGHNDEEVLNIMCAARRLYLPDEDEHTNYTRTRQLVDWVNTEWGDD